MDTKDLTPEEKRHFLLMMAVAGTIRDLHKEGMSVPSGPLYFSLMAVHPAMDLEMYEWIITRLIRLKAISKSNHLITWVGSPAIDTALDEMEAMGKKLSSS